MSTSTPATAPGRFAIVRAGLAAGLLGGVLSGLVLGLVLVAGGCALGPLQVPGIVLAAAVGWGVVGILAGLLCGLPAAILPAGLRSLGPGLAFALPGGVMAYYFLRAQGEAALLPPVIAGLGLLALGAVVGLTAARRLVPPRPARLAALVVLVLAAAWGLDLAGRPVHRLAVDHRPRKVRATAAARPPSELPFPRPRNAIIVLIDTLRADHLSCYGYERPTSPEIDALAASGTLFAQAIVQNPKTSPSVATILSGTYPHTHGIATIGTWLPDRVLLLPEVLAPRGFTTASFVANVNVGAIFNFDQGFQTMVQVGGRRVDNDAARVNAAVIPWLEEHRDDDRFFLYVHYVDPHAPYDPPEPYRDMFVRDEHWGAWDGYDVPFGDTHVGRIEHWLAIDDSTDVDLYVARYDAEIRYVDAKVGELLRELERLGLADDTLVVLVADHGESLGEHGWYFSHGLSLHETDVHVPLLFRLPGRLPAGRVVDGQVESVDIAPTVLDLLGIPTPPTMEGRSLVPLLLGDRREGEPVTHMEAGSRIGRQRKGIRTERWKLVYNADGIDLDREPFSPFLYLRVHRVNQLWATRRGGPGRYAMWSLWDLANDPAEERDLYRERPEVVERLRPLLVDWIAREPADRRPKRMREADMSPELREQLRSLGYVR